MRAIAIREYRAAAPAIHGVLLPACLALLILEPSGHPPYAEVSHNQMPRPAEQPVHEQSYEGSDVVEQTS